MTPLRVALEGFAPITRPVEPVVLVELLPWSVSHAAVVVMKDGQEFEPPEPLFHEMVVAPPPAGKLVPLLELMVNRLLLQVLCALRLMAPADPSNTTVAARQERNLLFLNTVQSCVSEHTSITPNTDLSLCPLRQP